MKQIEYFYNIIYYFFYRVSIKFANFIAKPIFFIYKYIYKIPKIRQYYNNKGINNPLKWHKQKFKNELLENSNLGYGTIMSAGFSISIIFFIYMGIYHIFKYSLFPTFEESHHMDFIILAILAFLTDVILCQKDNKGEKYIKEFNKRKGWWRTKWKIITILSLFLSLWFCLSTSSIGSIGRFLINLHSNI
ncbi:hypothetical protein [Malaciobacter marinus]|uniref:Putative membrane protein n=1 Tax=Malaciobacter marinus TaxID=505249 RepID=A0A347THQ3_9BACT|nr:hypothetical protein [Malaciobacter marinus]AXX86131.1 putative membrane protein [Malaciobacter marinus]PHO14948.1 hypothetical protein CPH92_09315 [Malaciobacter marinus]